LEILVYEGCISQPDRNVENPDNSDLLACIAQKSLEICERCRLGQQRRILEAGASGYSPRAGARSGRSQSTI
jgi:hypothetical protein